LFSFSSRKDICRNEVLEFKCVFSVDSFNPCFRREIFLMRRGFIFVTIFVFVICSANVYAGTARTAAPFLSSDGGTRAAGMADAFTAVSGDVISAFWNPSGLASISERQATIAYSNVSAMFGEASEGMYYALMAFAMPVSDIGVLGTTLQLYGQGTTVKTRAGQNGPEIIGEENLGTNVAWALCYADELAKGLLAGVNAKLIRQILLDASDVAYAADLGFQYAIPIQMNIDFMPPTPINIGIALQNLGTAIQMKDAYQSEPLPRNMKLGLALRIVDTPNHRFQMLFDYTSFIDKLSETEEDKKEPRFDPVKAGVGINAFRPENSQQGIGTEYWYANMLGIRVGYKYVPDKPGSRITMGFSIRYSNYQIDYARVPGADVPGGGDIDKVAVMFRF
jgi:hypothetical protein